MCSYINIPEISKIQTLWISFTPVTQCLLHQRIFQSFLAKGISGTQQVSACTNIRQRLRIRTKTHLWHYFRGGLCWILRKVSLSRGSSGTGTGSLIMALSLPEFSKCFDNILRHVVWLLGLSYVEPGVGIHDPCGFLPTQDILWVYNI